MAKTDRAPLFKALGDYKSILISIGCFTALINVLMLVPAIHDEPGYRTIRETLAAQYNLGNREPNVQI